ncbi:hypothetical protein EZS27_025494, partial [termite gut metagenome]
EGFHPCKQFFAGKDDFPSEMPEWDLFQGCQFVQSGFAQGISMFHKKLQCLPERTSIGRFCRKFFFFHRQCFFQSLNNDLFQLLGGRKNNSIHFVHNFKVNILQASLLFTQSIVLTKMGQMSVKNYMNPLYGHKNIHLIFN